MGSRKYVTYNCQSCGKRASAWDTWVVPRCPSCGISVCGCGMRLFCINCAGTLTPQEKDDFQHAIDAKPKGGGCCAALFCLSIPIGALLMLLGFNPTYSNPGMVVLWPIGLVGLVASVITMIIFSVKEKQSIKEMDRIQASLVPLIRERRKEGNATLANILLNADNIAESVMASANNAPQHNTQEHKFCMKCGSPIVDSVDNTGQKIRKCEKCNARY